MNNRHIYFILILFGSTINTLYGQSNLDPKKNTVPFGELEIEVSIDRLYSNTWDDSGEIRHSWYIKAYDANKIYYDDGIQHKENKRPLTKYPNIVIYRKYITGDDGFSLLGSMKYDFYGFEDDPKHGKFPDGNDLTTQGGVKKINQTINFNSLKLGTNYVETGNGYFKCRFKITLKSPSPPFLTYVENLSPNGEYNNSTSVNNNQNILIFKNSNLCEGRSAYLFVEKAIHPLFNNKSFRYKIESYYSGDNTVTPIYTVRFKSSGGFGKSTEETNRRPPEECTGEVFYSCPGNRNYDPSCEECVKVRDDVEPNWNLVKSQIIRPLPGSFPPLPWSYFPSETEFNGEHKLSKENYNVLKIPNIDAYSSGGQGTITFRVSLELNDGLSSATTGTPIFIRNPEPVLNTAITDFKVNDLNVVNINNYSQSADSIPVRPTRSGRTDYGIKLNSFIKSSSHLASGAGLPDGPIDPGPIDPGPIDPGPIFPGFTYNPGVIIRHNTYTGAKEAKIIINRVASGTGTYNFYLRKTDGVANLTWNIDNVGPASFPATFPDDSKDYGTDKSNGDLPAGDYLLVVENVVSGQALCYSYYDLVIREPEALLDISFVSEADIAVPGMETGSLKVNISGGVPPYRVHLRNSNGIISTNYESVASGAAFDIESEFPNLPPGSYMLSVQDTLGVEKWIRSSSSTTPVTYTISEPSWNSLELPAIVNTSITPTYRTRCYADQFNGSFKVADPDNIVLSYRLYNGSEAVTITEQDFTNEVSFSLISGGNYRLQVRAGSGNWNNVPYASTSNPTNQSIQFNRPAAFDEPTVNESRISCFNEEDGVIEITGVGGGVGTITVSLLTFAPGDGGAQTDTTPITPVAGKYTASDLNQLGINKYQIKIEDQLSCVKLLPSETDYYEFTNPALLTVSIPQPDIKAGAHHAICFDDPIQVDVNFNGGWTSTITDDDDESYYVEIRSERSTIVREVTDFNAAGFQTARLPSLKYYLRVYDDTQDQDCFVDSEEFEIITPSHELRFYSSISKKGYNGYNVSCYGVADGEITIGTTGGFGDHTVKIYQRVEGETAYTQISSKSQKIVSNVDGVLEPKSFTFTGLSATIEINNVRKKLFYKFALEDELGCVADELIGNDPDGISLTSPDPLEITGLSANELLNTDDGHPIYHIQCKNGFTSVNFSIAGGQTGYPKTIQLSNSSNTYTKEVTEPGAYQFDGVVAGNNYTISVASHTTYSCNDQVSITQPSIDIIEVTDEFEMTYTKLDYGNGYHVQCRENTDGTIYYEVSGGYLNGGGIGNTRASLSYAYNGQNILDTTPTDHNPVTKKFNNLPAVNTSGSNVGELVNYTLTVTDLLGCPEIETFTLTPADAPLAIDAINYSDHNGYEIACYGDRDQVSVAVSGGVLPYTLNLTGGPDNINRTVTVITAGNLATFTGLKEGTYSLDVEDVLGCPIENVNVVLDAPAEIQRSALTVTPPLCAYSADGIISYTIKGGYLATGNTYSVILTNKETLQQWTADAISGTFNVAEGTYELIATDDNNCTLRVSDQTIVVDNRPELDIKFDRYDYPKCYGGNTGKIHFGIKGGDTTGIYKTILYSEDWTALDSLSVDGAFANTLTAYEFDLLDSGIYHMVIEDGFGCVDREEDIILAERTDPLILLTDKDGISTTSCADTKDGVITMRAQEGDAPYYFSIDGLNFYPTQAVGEVLEDTIITDTITYQLAVHHDHIVWSGLAGGKNYTAYVRDSNWAADYDSEICTIENSYFLPKTDKIAVDFQIVPISCYGENDASIAANAILGTLSAGFNYKWYKSGTNEVIGTDATLANIGAGTYDLVVFNEDKPACSETFSATILPLAKPLQAVHISTSPITCSGINDGLLRFTVEGGYSRASYQVSIDGGLTFKNYDLNQNKEIRIASMAAGTAQVVLQDPINLCHFDFEVEIPYAVLAYTIEEVNDAACFGDASGKIVMSSASPSVFFEIRDSTNALLAVNETGVFNALQAGDYIVNAYQLNACRGIADTINITSPSAIAATVTIDQLPACGQANGALTIVPTGGIAPYTITIWNRNGDLEADADQLSAGFYNITITDAMGCAYDTYQFLEQQPALQISHTVKSVLTCDAAATIELGVSGGIAPYQLNFEGEMYTADNGTFNLQTNQSGRHDLIIADQLGCEQLYTVDLAAPITLNISLAHTTPATAGIDNGWVAVSVSGDAPYELQWSEEITETEGMRAYGLSGSRTYQVSAVQENGCSNTLTFSVGHKGVRPVAYELIQQASCGLENGAIRISNPTAQALSIHNIHSHALDTTVYLAAGQYTLQNVVEGQGMASQQVIIEEQQAADDFSIAIDEACDGAMVNIIDSGNHEIAHINWSHGGNTDQTSATAFTAGLHSVSIALENGCQFIKYFEIAAPVASMWVADYTAPNCAAADGTISMATTATSGIVAFSWSHDASITSASASGLESGQYTITAYDAQACQQDQIKFFLANKASALSMTIGTIVDASCPNGNDGQVQFSVSGTVGSYKVILNDTLVLHDVTSLTNLAVGRHQLVVEDLNGCTTLSSFNIGYEAPISILSVSKQAPSCHGGTDGQATLVLSKSTGVTVAWANGEQGLTASALTAGNQIFTIYDGGCEYERMLTIDSLSPLTVAMQQSTAPTCIGGNNGQIRVAASGGTAPYSYSWDNAAVGSSMNDAAGNYQLTLTDANGCTLTESFDIPQRAAIYFNTSIQAPSCNGDSNGAITVEVVGMESAFITWDNGLRGKTRAGLSAGTYGFVAEDQAGCTKDSTITLQDPAALTLTPTIKQPTCYGAFDGSIAMAVSGGTAPYTYAWSTGGRNSIISGKGAGSYELTVADNKGCTHTVAYELIAPEELLISDYTIEPSSCTSIMDASIVLTATGGTSPYTYLWSDGSTNKDLAGGVSGYYEVIITDANNCTLSQEFFIPFTPAIAVESVAITRPSCVGDADAAIVVTATGGSGALSYLWDTGVEGTSLTGLTAGTYVVTITDANNCFMEQAVNVYDPAGINFRANRKVDPSCNGAATGSITLDVVGGTTPYAYTWNTGAETASIGSLVAGEYSVTVTDARGCTISQNFSVNDPPKYEITNIDPLIEICTGGSITLDAGAVWETVRWSSANGYAHTGRTATVSQEGTYTIAAETALGCSDSFEFTLDKKDDILSADFVITSTTYTNDTIVMVDVSNPQPENVTWSNDEGILMISQNKLGQQIIIREPGTYTIGMTAYSGECADYVERVIEATIRPDIEEEDDMLLTRNRVKPKFEQININPNPNNGVFELLVLTNVKTPINVSIYNIHGDVTYPDVRTSASKKRHQFTIDDIKLNDGLYIIRIQSDFGVLSKKFVVK